MLSQMSNLFSDNTWIIISIMSRYWYINIYLSIYLSIYLILSYLILSYPSIYLSIYLYIYIYIFPFHFTAAKGVLVLSCEEFTVHQRTGW